ncbi:MAG: manganese ABC transporter ATP-binding protein [Chloroflexi bacterium]|nr:MAG: manganese ABC transporter ATP-binding protein [Chloroflexota bacterium]
MPTLFTHPAVHDQRAPTLELAGVSVRYDGTPALEDVSFQVTRGDQVAVVGPNGAGKSTLFNVVAGILKPQQGSVRVYGSGPRGHICVGYVPQRNRIDWRFPVSVADVVMMGRVGKIGLGRRPSRADWQQVEAALAQVEMSALTRRQIGELSGGQQQRVFLARALAQEAELLLLDEPLAGLDMPSQDAILRILARMRGQGMTVLIATHDLNQAAGLFDKMILLNRRVIAYGPPAAVLTPDNLGRAYGGQLHVVHTDAGDVLVTDSCCGGGEPPVAQIVGSEQGAAPEPMAR